MFNINIKIKITILVAALFMLFGTVQLITDWYNLKLQFDSIVLKQAGSVLKQESDLLSSRLTAGPLTGTDLSVTASDLSDVKGMVEGAYAVDVFADDGSIIASTLEESGTGKLPDELLNYIKAARTASARIETGEYIYFVRPVIAPGGTTAAYISIILSKKGITAFLMDIFGKTIWTGVIAYILTVFVTYFAVLLITKPVSKLLSHTEQIGSGDLTHMARIYSLDEFGLLTRAFNDMSIKLKEVIVKIRDVTKDVGGIANTLSDTYNTIEKTSSREISGLKTAFGSISSALASIDDIAATMDSLATQYSDLTSALNQFTSSIGEVDNSAEKLAVSIGDISITIEEIVSSIKEVTKNISELSRYIEESNSSIHEIRLTTKEISQHAIDSSKLAETVVNESIDGLKSADITIDGIGKIKQTTDDIVRSINLLVKSSNQIAEVLDSINQIADKTNLLALNAAIIANQAGEHGKGFAVVAQEINDLAERTRISTTEIDRIVKSINAEMQKAKLAADAGIKAVEDGINFTRVTHKNLSIINDSTKNNHTVALSIEKMIKEQSITINTISEAQEMLSKVSKQILAAMNDQVTGTSQINQTVEGIKELTNKLHLATSEQTKSIQLISRNAENTMHSMTTMNQTIGTQKKESRAAVDTIDTSIKNIEDNLAVIKKTDTLLSQFRELLEHLRESVGWFKLE